MQWTAEAEAAKKKVIRKKVRFRVDKEAAESGKRVVEIESVNTI